MALTWYSLQLMPEKRDGLVCSTERHAHLDKPAIWVEQLLDLEARMADSIWYTCDECHEMMQAIQESTSG